MLRRLATFSRPNLVFLASRSASGYHTVDTHNLFTENKYTPFKKQTVKIGELIGFVDKLKELYKLSNEDTQKMLATGAEMKLDTVMEYYCNKGKGEPIREILESMPAAGTHQAYLYYTQAHINAQEMDQAEQALEMLQQNGVYTKQPFELVLHAYSKQKNWEAALRVMKKMQNYGYPATYDTIVKLQNLYE